MTKKCSKYCAPAKQGSVFGPNRVAADMREMENLILGDLLGFLENFEDFWRNFFRNYGETGL